MDRKPDSPSAPARARDVSRPAVRHDVPQVGADLHATLEARRELGQEYEGALVEGFLERLDQAIDARVDARLEQRRTAAPPTPPARAGVDGTQLALGIVTAALGIPLTAIVSSQIGGVLGLVGVLIVWVGIVLVNVAGAMSRRR